MGLDQQTEVSQTIHLITDEMDSYKSVCGKQGAISTEKSQVSCDDCLQKRKLEKASYKVVVNNEKIETFIDKQKAVDHLSGYLEGMEKPGIGYVVKIVNGKSIGVVDRQEWLIV